MKIAILVCVFNRPEYLKKCLWSLERADLSKVATVMFIDDCSTYKEIDTILNNVSIKNKLMIGSDKNLGIKRSLLFGYDQLFPKYDLVINLDSDAIVHPDFVERLTERYISGTILTGFHCTTKNTNGTDRHKIIHETDQFYIKQSVGGINFCIDKYAYKDYVRTALLSDGNWDHNSCINAENAYCLKQSVVQHIGIESSLNHNEPPDIADDFYYWDLPSVTLLGVDINKERLDKAKGICTKWIKFGSVVTINPNIRSKEAYSEFIIKEAYKLVKTSHCLIFQHDGFVNNWQAWDNNWLQYDYIGAPWHYSDGMAVGNGGFSLRSKRLMEIVANDPCIQAKHPEDHHLCRTYRYYLEKTYGIKFAPVEVAEKFSFEGFMQPGKFLTDQFGVHGANPRKQPTPMKIRNEKYVVNQYQGAGDILFLVPMIRALLHEGNEVIWPIIKHYFNMAKHFPDIDMREMSTVPIDYSIRHKTPTPYGYVLPYRFSSENMGVPLTQCMQSKYAIYGHDYNIWRGLYYKRFADKEKELAKLIGAKGEYILANKNFGEPLRNLSVNPVINSALPVIEMSIIDGYSLIDWLGVIEGAKEFHTANTSIMYLLELMDLQMPVYVYKRKTWGEIDFEHTAALWTNRMFIFEK